MWLSADVSRRLRAIAACSGLEPEQVLAQLADGVRIDDDGALPVDTFTPRWLVRAMFRTHGSQCGCPGLEGGGSSGVTGRGAASAGGRC